MFRALFFHENCNPGLDMGCRDPLQADRADRKGAADDVSAGATGFQIGFMVTMCHCFSHLISALLNSRKSKKGFYDKHGYVLW
jgi:hypothetical protein